MIGATVQKVDIRSSLAPFLVAPEYRVEYPAVVVEALAELYLEYNKNFAPLLALNREWDTDFRYAIRPDGIPVNFAVQIDMAGLEDPFLRTMSAMPKEEMKNMLHRRIFEFENSIAMYHIFESVLEKGGTSRFKAGWRAALADLRQQHSRPIALLACTDDKYETMLGVEFCRTNAEHLSNDEVQELSGFDRYFSPTGFREHLSSNGGHCEYLLFVRASDPVSKLKKPEKAVESPLLSDPDLRRIVKENALTLNIDNPAWPAHDPRRINDTKAYMPAMNMAVVVESDEDIYSPEFLAHLANRGAYADFPVGGRLSTAFSASLASLGVDARAVEAGDSILRFKPMRGAYGCYGHVHGPLTDVDLRRELRINMRKRGTYIVQPEIASPTISGNGNTYVYMDRIFMTFTNGAARFIGGFRMLMPTDSWEAKAGRNHGSRYSVWAEIDNQETWRLHHPNSLDKNKPCSSLKQKGMIPNIPSIVWRKQSTRGLGRRS